LRSDNATQKAELMLANIRLQVSYKFTSQQWGG